MTEATKPYPNEHACRIRQPGEFQPDSFRRIQNGKLSVIIGKLTGKDTTTTQAFRYPIDDWTEEQARKHCEEQSGSFEPAAEAKRTATASVKAVAQSDSWELDILGVPYGDEQDRDADGEWFDADTEMHEDRFGLPPLVHYHGYGDNKQPVSEPEYVGRTIKRWVDAAGVWFRAVLDKGSALAADLWQAAKNGTLRASSGSVAHLVRTDPDGHIREWPVAELSILDTATGKNPANRYAVALPVAKAIYARAGLAWPEYDSAPGATPEAGDTAAVAERRERAAQLRARAYDILFED